MLRSYILKNKSQVAIISSLFLHTLLLLSIQSDESLGTTKTPIEFTEIKIVSSLGESIKKNNLNKLKKNQTQKKITQQNKSKNIRNELKANSDILINSNTKKESIQRNQNKKGIFKREVNQASEEKKSSIRGTQSQTKKNQIQSGKLKGKGKKAIICKKCLEPIYSQKSIRKGLEGITTVEVTINTNGLVTNAKIINSSGHKEIDNSSISAALNSTFQPILEKSIITIKYEHKIK